jgi:hypothetical protein
LRPELKFDGFATLIAHIGKDADHAWNRLYPAADSAQPSSAVA